MKREIRSKMELRTWARKLPVCVIKLIALATFLLIPFVAMFSDGTIQECVRDWWEFMWYKFED